MSSPDASTRPSTDHWWRSFLLCALLAAPFILGFSLTEGLTHDENQHVAAGALVAREGLLPYRDFPHFHTPYLAYVYAGLFHLTDHLLLAGRLFSALCAAAAVGLVGAETARVLRPHGSRAALVGAAGAVTLILFARVFTHSVGYAWNHEPPLFCAVAAFLLLLSGLERASAGRVFGAGLLLGLAIGFRLTYAPLIAPLGLATLLAGGGALRARLRTAAVFSAGLLLALSGIAGVAFFAPEQAWFANFEFAKVNITYRFRDG